MADVSGAGDSRLLREKQLWDAFAEADPLWAVLSDPGKTGRRWTLESFFETGKREISLVLHELKRTGVELRRGVALDFGCGVGRLTQPLGQQFDRAIGIDVSAVMVGHARALNQQAEHITFIENPYPDLRLIVDGSIDFLYSNIVLQHLPTELAWSYIQDFPRVLAPGGVAVFQVPSHKRVVTADTYSPVVMPDAAYRASLAIFGAGESVVRSGQKHELTISVRNESPVDWDQQQYGILRIGNHWRVVPSSQMTTQDDGRQSLPPQLRSGASCSLTLTVTAPNEPGDYECEVDVVHEGVTWFSDRESPTVRARLSVTEGPQPSAVLRASGVIDAPGIEVPLTDAEFNKRLATPSMSAPTEFPMNGVPFERVKSLEGLTPVRLVWFEADGRCGPEWEAYRYCFQKT